MGQWADKRLDRKGNKRREVLASGQTTDKTEKAIREGKFGPGGRQKTRQEKAIREGQFGTVGRQQTRQKRQIREGQFEKLNLETMNDSLHIFLKEALESSSGMGRDVYSLSIQHFLWRRWSRPPSEMP